MRSAQLAAALPDVLHQHWGVDGAVVLDDLVGGMNSAVVSVRTTSGSFVAKWVPAAARGALERGAVVALRLAGGGMASGEPRRTSDGSLTAPLGGGVVAMLRRVPGDPLGTGADDQLVLGSALARAHRIAGPGLARPPFFPWIRKDDPGADLEP